MGSCNANSCEDYNEKSEIVSGFIGYAIELEGNVRNLSDRQMRVYERYIDLLNDAPRTYTMYDVQLLTFNVEHIMECECSEEDFNKSYGFVFNSLNLKIRELMAQETKQRNRMERGRYCWKNNPHFCKDSKPYYDKTVELGLMNKDYSWAKNTTKFQIATWIDEFARKFKFTEQWVWAETVWPKLKNLRQALNKSKEKVNEDKVQIVKELFK